MDNYCKYPSTCGIGSDCSECLSDALTAANARIAYFEQLAADRLVQMTADAERIAELEETLVTPAAPPPCWRRSDG
ncbi:hypothetical protein A3724_16290 [Alcanivorax sp. HI0033]|uniref:hypothetical protein n=1 Tax=unclassified Alcanivorax TaxID=2638842 RepID=UPI0007B8CC7D|nr:MULTISPECIES: hypothetical protein [unclassified Alcanivorax]KZX74347.1 hypothetical protein A3716_12355 [Alcanivorax sp. HI0011]KZX75710.1 hypothetical protein A3717_22320 [Alcanivorax sp. HI0013]KZY22665.1 hypothetical protein A3725_17310 [Alcanivorax sp. HI0035]KZX65847.1 hypothetical protein A3714_01935 [Alcanivorax sp. HI0007]KZX70854.1 hypothetical protein A3713_01405 [Alcanivorax sp. HI0003]